MIGVCPVCQQLVPSFHQMILQASGIHCGGLGTTWTNFCSKSICHVLVKSHYEQSQDWFQYEMSNHVFSATKQSIKSFFWSPKTFGSRDTSIPIHLLQTLDGFCSVGMALKETSILGHHPVPPHRRPGAGESTFTTRGQSQDVRSWQLVVLHLGIPHHK